MQEFKYDKKVIEVYRELMGDVNVIYKDFFELAPCEIPKSDVPAASLPIQPFSIATKRLQGSYELNKLYWDIFYQLVRCKMPKCFLIETTKAAIKNLKLEDYMVLYNFFKFHKSTNANQNLHLTLTASIQLTFQLPTQHPISPSHPFQKLNNF